VASIHLQAYLTARAQGTVIRAGHSKCLHSVERLVPYSFTVAFRRRMFYLSENSVHVHSLWRMVQSKKQKQTWW